MEQGGTEKITEAELKVILEYAGKTSDDALSALTKWIRGMPDYMAKLEPEALKYLKSRWSRFTEQGMADDILKVLEKECGGLADDAVMGLDDVKAVVEKAGIIGGRNFKGQLYKGIRNRNIDFVNAKGKSTLNKHAGKHGYTSSEEYLKDARNFLEKEPTATTQSFVSNEGTYFRYDTATNEFEIISKYGGISTYFKPEDEMLYWLEQIEKYAPK